MVLVFSALIILLWDNSIAASTLQKHQLQLRSAIKIMRISSLVPRGIRKAPSLYTSSLLTENNVAHVYKVIARISKGNKENVRFSNETPETVHLTFDRDPITSNRSTAWLIPVKIRFFDEQRIRELSCFDRALIQRKL